MSERARQYLAERKNNKEKNMSDVMFYGVLRMPQHLAMATPLSRGQFYSRAQEAADRVEAAEKRIAELEAQLADYAAMYEPFKAMVDDVSDAAPAPRFSQTSCSQCGKEFGPGDHGYSHCRDHAAPEPDDKDKRIAQLEKALASCYCHTAEHLAEVLDLPAPSERQPVAWYRQTDITELTDSEPETDGWTPLYE
jgi:hypothetical protein